MVAGGARGDRDRAPVDVRFDPDGSGTRVSLIHRGFERHGEAAGAYADQMGSEDGWPYILERFAACPNEVMSNARTRAPEELDERIRARARTGVSAQDILDARDEGRRDCR